MTDFRPSWFTTWEEMEQADSVDIEKLRCGLETRTACCQQVVPTDCLNAACGHGRREFTDPLTGEPLCPPDGDPCEHYSPGTRWCANRTARPAEAVGRPSGKRRNGEAPGMRRKRKGDRGLPLNRTARTVRRPPGGDGGAPKERCAPHQKSGIREER